MTMNENDKQAEPVAWMYRKGENRHLTFTNQQHINAAYPNLEQAIPLYTHPPQPLGNAELEQIWKTKFELQFGVSRTLFMAIAREVMHPTIGGLRSGE